MGDIVINRLSKRFGDHVILRDFSLTLKDQTITALMGPSGIGKTTLLRLLSGLDLPDSGQITGLENRRIGVVFQEDRLLDWLDTVENLKIVSVDDHLICETLTRWGLGEALHQPVSQLSGGMRRRIALLRALLSPAEVLLLDEPFNGLDEATRDIIIPETLRLIRHRTTLLITHHPVEAQLTGALVVAMS